MENDKPTDKPDPAEKPYRVPLRQRLRAKFDKAKKSEVAEVLKDTADDLKSNNKERVGLAVATVIPGGWFAYYAHRHHKYKKKHANDDTPEAPEASELPKKKPATPKP
jgi:hypothetical protein